MFSYDKMVALEGNTATYMQYSYARTQSIFQRGSIQPATLRTAAHPILLGESAERDLALELVQFGDALDKSLEDYRPNVLTAYLFSLATKFSRFYQQCDVLRAEPEAVRTSRLVLCDLTGRTIQQGLALLGIGLPTGLAAIGAALALGPIGSASLAVIAEKPEMFGRTLVYMGLAEGIAIYGLVMSILMLGRL